MNLKEKSDVAQEQHKEAKEKKNKNPVRIFSNCHKKQWQTMKEE